MVSFAHRTAVRIIENSTIRASKLTGETCKNRAKQYRYEMSSFTWTTIMYRLELLPRTSRSGRRVKEQVQTARFTICRSVPCNCEFAELIRFWLDSQERLSANSASRCCQTSQFTMSKNPLIHWTIWNYKTVTQHNQWILSSFYYSRSQKRDHFAYLEKLESVSCQHFLVLSRPWLYSIRQNKDSVSNYHVLLRDANPQYSSQQPWGWNILAQL